MRFWEAMKALEEGRAVTPKSYLFPVSKKSLKELVDVEPLTYWEDEWELYQESAQTYTLQEIIPFLKEGKKVKRMEWNLDLPILLNACGDIVDTDGWLVGSCIRDLEATDWIVVE